MPDPGGGNWEERLVLRLLRAEAESVVHGDEARHR
jgi:hypothetical protein